MLRYYCTNTWICTKCDFNLIVCPLPIAQTYHRPSDRRFSAKLVPTFVNRGCRVVSVTVPYIRILGFLDRSRYVFFQVAPQLYSRGWVDPVPDPLLIYFFYYHDSIVVKALCYKPEGSGFDTRWDEFLNLLIPSDRTRPGGLLSF
jgi:hypothetical protein